MKILLINNSTKHLSKLQKSLAEHDLEVINYQPGLVFNWQDKDLVILSGGGGEGREANDEYQRGRLWYEDEMKLVRYCKKPIVGICMGFEIISRAFGAEVTEVPKLIKGFRELQTTTKGQLKLPVTRLRQYESHQWAVPIIDEAEFEILLQSDSGIELMVHKKRPIIASQFHPEVSGGTMELVQIISLLKSPV